MQTLWMVNQLWFIVPVNLWKNPVSAELLYKSNRIRKSLACGTWFTNFSRVLPKSLVVYQPINNGNWTEWSAIWCEIICVISKSNERAARVRFEITSMIWDQNCTPLSSITTLLYKHQWNTKWAFPRKLHIFTREDNMLSSHVKRSPSLWLHNKSRLWVK